MHTTYMDRSNTNLKVIETATTYRNMKQEGGTIDKQKEIKLFSQDFWRYSLKGRPSV